MRSSGWVGFYKIWMIALPKMANPSRKSKKSNSREKVKVKEAQMMRGPKDGCLEIIKWAISTLPSPASPMKDRWKNMNCFKYCRICVMVFKLLSPIKVILTQSTQDQNDQYDQEYAPPGDPATEVFGEWGWGSAWDGLGGGRAGEQGGQHQHHHHHHHSQKLKPKQTLKVMITLNNETKEATISADR